MDRDSYKSLSEAYKQIQEQGNRNKTNVTSGQVAGNVDRMLLRNLQRYIDNAVKAGRGIYDKSKEAGDAIIKGTADFTSDRITGGNTGDTIIRDRQKEAEKARQAIGADGATGTLTNPVGALNNILKQSGLPTIPGGGGNQQDVSRGGETPEERAARRARVGLTGNGEAGSPTGITSEVARKQNAADAAAGRSTVRDTATGEPTNVGGDSPTSDTPAATPAASTNRDGSDVTQKDSNSAGLTPMQQWAKNFPELAKKVKPGQAGYDEINRTSATEPSSPTLTRSNFSRNMGTVNSGSQNMNRNVRTSTPNINRPNLSSNMNKVKAKVGQAFAGLPEEVFIDMLVQQGLAPDTESAKVIAEHMSPEYREHLEESWKTMGEFLGNTWHSVKRGTEGKKVRKDANPVHRALNSFTRGTIDATKAFGSGLTGGSTVGDKKTQDTKKETEAPESDSLKAETSKAETSKAEPPKSTPASSTPAKSKSERAPKPSEDKTGAPGGRLDSALKWASDPKNKDAWMKSEAVGKPKVHYLKDMDPYDPRRRLQQLAPGSPLPPADTRPGLPDMRLPRASKSKDERKPKKA